VLALVVGGVVWLVARPGGGCDTTATVRVAVAPEVEPAVAKLLAHPLRSGDACVRADVTAQRPLETVGSLGTLRPSALPQVWVPDSSLWASRASGAHLTSAGSFATSPVVLATSRAAVTQLGWESTAPTWGQAVSSNRALAVPDLAASAEGLAALAAVRTSLGGNSDADNAVVAAVLSAARGPAVSTDQALAAAGKNAADAPLVPVSEQRVYAAGHGGGTSLVAVYPSEGSPRLDYPVLRVGRAAGSASAIVAAVVSRLRSADAGAAATRAGFRSGSGNAPPGATAAGIHDVAPADLPLDPAQAQQLLARISSLAAPSRILAVFDVSTSMKAPVGDGTRATLERDAAKSALSLIPDSSAIGLWNFAYHLHGADDWAELVPTQRLDTQLDGQTQRDALSAALDGLPSHLTPGGTGLYDTTLAAVRKARAEYDPAAVDSVLLVTDGADDDDAGAIHLDALVSALKSEADPAKPVKVIAVALGPDADIDALRQIASATGGAAYSAVDPKDLQRVLFDALRQRG
jgi:Ca-activated chloride channel family protein